MGLGGTVGLDCPGKANEDGQVSQRAVGWCVKEGLWQPGRWEIVRIRIPHPSRKGRNVNLNQTRVPQKKFCPACKKIPNPEVIY